MKTWIIIASSIFLLVSCSGDWSGEKSKQITNLENEIRQLKEENKKLRDENASLQYGITTPNFWNVEPWNMWIPADMSWEDTSSKKCIEKVRQEYIELGNKQCEQMGYSVEDMKAWKCLLTKEFIEVLNKRMMDAELVCGPG